MARQLLSCAKERKFERALPQFVEKILFMIFGVTKGVARVDRRWKDGVFRGVSDRSVELCVGTERGMHEIRTLGRREAIETVVLKFLNAVTARRWDGPRSVRDHARGAARCEFACCDDTGGCAWKGSEPVHHQG